MLRASWSRCTSPLLNFVGAECQIYREAAHTGIRDKYLRRLEQRGHIFVKFGSWWCVVLAVVFPNLAPHNIFWIVAVNGASFLVPREAQETATAWAMVVISLFTLWFVVMEFGDAIFQAGFTHSMIAGTLVMFFSGLGARGAALYLGGLCVMLSTYAPTNIQALHIGTACLGQMALCVILEASMLRQLLELHKHELETAIEKGKDNLMAIISHELKSPLHGIIGLIRSTDWSEGTDQTHQKHVALIRTCAERLLQMVTNIMDSSAIMNNKQVKLSRDAVQLDRLVEDVVTLCKHSVDRAGKPVVRDRVTLINAVSPLPVIEADAHQCTQVIQNLLTNALKFTHAGYVKVTGEADDRSGIVTLTVADTGIGIAPENLESIFRPFNQEDKTVGRHKYDGLGLGLSICKDVLTRHGGSLAVESTKGAGSKFHIVLPYKMAVAADPPGGEVKATRQAAGSSEAVGRSSATAGSASNCPASEGAPGSSARAAVPPNELQNTKVSRRSGAGTAEAGLSTAHAPESCLGPTATTTARNSGTMASPASLPTTEPNRSRDSNEYPSIATDFLPAIPSPAVAAINPSPENVGAAVHCLGPRGFFSPGP